jgi:4-hydroxy-3-polyprenylbenzoate decarboxylase
MAFKDIREFISKLETEGEVKRIEEEVDWNLEAGAMSRLSNEAGLPAPFFQKIKDYPTRYRLFSEALSNHRRIAVAMDLDPDTHVKVLIEKYLKRKEKPIKPVMVKNGPCKENIRIGQDVDLFEFPVPLIHEGDGGRYIGTWHITINKDPDSDWVNWGMYRHMLHDKRTIGLLAGPPTHAGMIIKSLESKNRPVEIAIAIGVEPISTFCAAAPMPYGVSEVDIVGGIRGEPVELIKCETVDLEVPATSEIVLEGEVGVNEKMEEGPFGEYTGYVGGHRELRTVIHVKAVTFRNDPILTMMNEGMPVTSTHATQSITRSAECYEMLRKLGLPVTGVFEFAEACTLLVVVAVKAGRARADEVANGIWSSRLRANTPYIIIIEDDVDPYDLKQVIHAVVSKCHPYRGIVRMERVTGTALMPWLTKHEQKNLLGAKAYFDCTWPPDWDLSEVPKQCSFRKIYPEEVQQRALERWARYGYQMV